MATKKQKSVKLVPKLRFPEFENDGEWVNEQIGKFLVESRIPGSSGDVAKKLTVKLWGKGVFAKNDTIAGSINTRYYKRKAGQFIYSKLDFLNQAFAIIPEQLDGYESTVDLPCFDVSKKLNSQFFLEYVQRINFYKKYGEIADGGRKAKRIQVEIFQEFPVSIPPKYKEQKKIADCLDSLDKLIAAHSTKLEALQDHKKGLLQKLFPAKGKNTPELRFPEFKDYEPWLEEKAGFLFSNRKEKGEQKLPLYSVTMNEGMVSRKSLDRKIDNLQDASGNKKVHYNDIAYNMMRMWQGAVGVAPEDCMVSPAYIVLSPRVELSSAFFTLYFKLPQSLEKLKAHSRGLTSDRLRLYYDDFSKILLPAPSYKEQKRIAAHLETLEKIIKSQSLQVEALREHKNSLMLQIFPENI